MTKQGTINFLKKDHEKMEDVLVKLSMKQKILDVKNYKAESKYLLAGLDSPYTA